MSNHSYYSAGSGQYPGASSYGNGFGNAATAAAPAPQNGNAHASTSYYGQSSSASHGFASLNGYSQQVPQHATSSNGGGNSSHHHHAYHSMSAPAAAAAAPSNGLYGGHPAYTHSAPATHAYSPYGANPYGGAEHGLMGLPMGHHAHVAANGLASMGVRPKRKQVKNACINCQKACKKCDEGRPCSRCIKYGLTDSCQDSSRKERKRGVKRGPYKRRGLTSTTQVSTSNEGSASASASAPEDMGSMRSNGGGAGDYGSNRQFPSRSPYSAASDSNASSAFDSGLTPAGLYAPNRYSSNASYDQAQPQQQQPQQQQGQVPRRFEGARLTPSSSSTSSSLGFGGNYYGSMQGGSNTLPALSPIPSNSQAAGSGSGHHRFHSDSFNSSSTTPSSSSLGPHTPLGSSNGSLADAASTNASSFSQSLNAYANYAKASSSSSSSSSSSILAAPLSSSSSYAHQSSAFLQPLNGMMSSSGAGGYSTSFNNGGRREGSAPSSSSPAFGQLRPSSGNQLRGGLEQQQQQQQQQLSSSLDYSSSTAHHGQTSSHGHHHGHHQYGGSSVNSMRSAGVMSVMPRMAVGSDDLVGLSAA